MPRKKTELTKAQSENPKEKKQYKPTKAEAEDIEWVYQEYALMRDVCLTQTYPEFNNRTLKQFLDDCQKRANSFVPSKADQGKDDWQANVFTPTTRNKIKAHIASIAKAPPEISVTAYDKKNFPKVHQAEIMKNLVHSSYITGEQNPEVTIFLDGWNGAINGTKYTYSGYLKVKNKVKLLKDYDVTTGEATWEEKEEIVEDKCIELDVPVQNLLFKNPYCRNLQDQSALIWVDYYDKDRFDFEFGNYKNAKEVKNHSQMLTQGDEQLFFGNYWKQRMGDKYKNLYEVVRYYNKLKDVYIVVVNGVLLLSVPLLWGRKRKKYPFASTIFEPFANSNFAWGNSIVNILMAEQDVENALINSMVDKTFRSLVVPMLIGIGNKDAFDLEDEYVTGDTKIYVDNVEQVKPMPIAQVNQSEIAMLKIIKGGLQEDSTDSVQGGASGSGSTAREIVIANERAEELKGLFFTMLKDLWIQKYNLRTLTILMNYSQAEASQIIGEDDAQQFEEQYKTFHVPNAKLSDGSVGNMVVEVKKDQSQLSRPWELDTRETTMAMQGMKTEIVQITSDFLDDYEYVYQIESDSMYQKSKALQMAMLTEKIQGVAELFPEIFSANKEEFFRDYMEGHNDDPEKYLKNLQMQPQDMMGMMGGQQPGQPQGSPLQKQLTAPTKPPPSLSKLAGVQ